MRIISDEIELNPGIEIDGRRITTATVRLLYQAEADAINQIEDLEERSQRAFVEQIHSLGAETDRQKIEVLSGSLVLPDEERLQAVMRELIPSITITFAIPLPPSEPLARAGSATANAIERIEDFDSPDGRYRMVVGNWQQLAAVAWDGFQELGRGALHLALKFAEGTNIPMRYLPFEETPETQELRWAWANAKDYDPRRQFVVMIHGSEITSTRIMQSGGDELLDPPDAYQAEKDNRGNDSYLN